MTRAPIWDALDKDLPGQSQAVRALSAVVANNALSHAYVFAGPTASGRLEAAITLAVAANCAHGGCGQCTLCASATALREGKAASPDIVVERPDGAEYPIEQLREIRRRLASRPVELATKFLIVVNAERMRDAAANTLLKTIEEPPANTTIVLITSRYDAMLSTIKSRCQLIEFRPVSEELSIGKLVGRHGISVTAARVAHHAAGGRPDVAGRLVGSTAFLRARSVVSTIVDELGRRDPAHLVAYAARLEGLIDDLGEAVGSSLEDMPYTVEEIKDMAVSRAHAGHLRAVRDDRVKRAEQVRKLEGSGVLLDLFALAYRDLLCAASGTADLVADSEALARRSAFVRHAGVLGAAHALEAIAGARTRMGRNVLPKNALLSMLLDLAEVSRWRRQSA